MASSMRKCCVKGCETNITTKMYRFPADESIRAELVKRLDMKGAKISSATQVCAKHFRFPNIGQKFLRKGSLLANKESIVWRRAVTEKLIKLLRTQRCLWDVSIGEYRIRKKRDISLDIICKELRRDMPTISKDDVRFKIVSLRSQYRKQMRQLLAGRSNCKSGYAKPPSLWCFDLLKFLQPVLKIKLLPENDMLSQPDKEEIQNFVDFPHIDMKLSSEESAPPAYIISRTSEAESEQSTTPAETEPPVYNISQTSEDESEQSTTPQIELPPEQVNDDRHDVFGKNVSMKLRYVRNNTQRIFAEKLINEALFLAELNQLTQKHYIYSPTLKNRF